MIDRMRLLECALDGLPEGLAVLDSEGRVVVWNQAAGEITGRPPGEMVGLRLPEALHGLLHRWPAGGPEGHGTLVPLLHRLGHQVAAVARRLPLCDEAGAGIGSAVLFRPAQRLDALPLGEVGEDREVQASQEDFEERLRAEFANCERDEQPLGVLWIRVDQGEQLRKTRGIAASEAMLASLGRALGRGLRPAEEIGRWGENEFLVIAHERTAEMLAVHARTLAAQARTTEFRWWGDRISLTVSVGAAQAIAGEPLEQLLARARAAMENCQHAGGNCATTASPAEASGKEGSGGEA